MNDDSHLSCRQRPKLSYWPRVWRNLVRINFGLPACVTCILVTLIACQVSTVPHWWMRLFPLAAVVLAILTAALISAACQKE